LIHGEVGLAEPAGRILSVTSSSPSGAPDRNEHVDEAAHLVLGQQLGADHPAKTVANRQALSIGEQRQAHHVLHCRPAAGQLQDAATSRKKPRMTASSTPEWLATHSSRPRSAGAVGTPNAASGATAGSKPSSRAIACSTATWRALTASGGPGSTCCTASSAAASGNRGPALHHRGPQHVCVEREPDRLDRGGVQHVSARRRQSLVQAGGPPTPQRVGLAALLAAAVDEDQGAHRSLQGALPGPRHSAGLSGWCVCVAGTRKTGWMGPRALRPP